MTQMRLRYPGTCVRCGAPLAAGSQGDLYFSGAHSGGVTAGSHSIGSPIYGVSDCFVGRVNASGTVSWLYGFNSDHTEYAPRDMVLDEAAGRLYLAAHQHNGGPTYDLLQYSSQVVALNANETGASLSWSHRIGARTRDVAVDSAGAVYIVGDLSGTADFDPSGGTFNVSSGGGSE